MFACSGAADAGEISDLAARKLTAESTGKMFCLAGIGGRVSGIMETKAAAAILALDGCPLDCARKTLEEAGFSDFEHLRLPGFSVTGELSNRSKTSAKHRLQEHSFEQKIETATNYEPEGVDKDWTGVYTIVSALS